MTRLHLVAAIVCALVLGHGPASANMAPPINDFRLGLTLESMRTGARVLAIEAGSAGEQMGLRTGDILLAVDHHYVRSLSKAELKAFAQDAHVWPVEIILVRDGRDVIELRFGR